MNTRRDRPRRQYDLALASADFREWNGAPRRTLLICTQQRSGSTLLGEAIYFARDLGCPLEYFHAGFRPSFQARWATAGIREYVAALHRFRTDPSGVFSAKLFWWDVAELVRELEPSEFDSLPTATASATGDGTYRRIFATLAAVLPDPTFIVLNRQDEIRQAVSCAIAAQTGAWRQLSDPACPPGAPPPAFDFHRIVHELAAIQNDNAHWGNFFRANQLSYHPVRYEDLSADYERTLKTLFGALGRSDLPITPPRLRKQGNARSEALLQQFTAEFRQRSRG